MIIEQIRELIKKPDNIIWSVHAAKRLISRGITRNEVIDSIISGEIIEEYPDTYPHPSCLVCGCSKKGRILHTCIGSDGISVWVITAYIPSLDKFMEDWKTRR